MADESTTARTESALPLRVVVDTSVIRRTNGDLTRGDWPALRAACRLGLITLHLPTVALQELVDHRRRDFGSLIRLERDAYALRQRLDTPRTNDFEWHTIVEAGVDRRCDDYRSSVSSWFAELGSVLADPSVAHSELVDRILAKRRPFNDSERGFRDALVWYSTLELADRDRTALLTGNTKDFASKSGDELVLADDLVDDLRARGHDSGRVVLYTSTGDLLRAVLPDWDGSTAASAWTMFASSLEFVGALDDELDRGLGYEFTAAPAAPPFVWGLGLRAVSEVTTAHDTRLVADGDGWFRVHSQLEVLGRVGGYVWAWGDPEADTQDYTVSDTWGGLTEYWVSDRPVRAWVTVAARFRPTVDLEDLEILDVTNDPLASFEVARQSNTGRHLRALRDMLARHLDRQAFLDDVLGDSSGEFIHIVSGLLVEADPVIATLRGRFEALAPDNSGTTLTDVAGLRAVKRDLDLVVEALESDAQQA